MAIGAIIGAIAGIGSAVLGAQGQQQAQDAQFQAAEDQARKRFERDVREWEFANQVAEAQYYWDVARIEQLRFNERQKESDFYGYQSQLINAASNQLGTRIDGLRQGLNTRLEGLELGLNTRLESLDIRDTARAIAIQGEGLSRMAEISTRAQIENQQEAARASVDYTSRMQTLTIETLEATRQYLNQANQVASEAAQLVGRINLDTQELVDSLALEEQRDYLGWQLNKITALVDDSRQGNTAITRQGGGKTSKRLMLEAGKALGRQWGELQVRAQSRQTRLGLLNNTINSQYAQQMARYSLATEDLAGRTASTLKRSDAESTALANALTQITIPSIQQRARLAGVQLQGVFTGAEGQINVLRADNRASRNEALSEFRIASAEATTGFTTSALSAYSDYDSTLANVTRPFRPEIYFDPLKPIPGLKPEYIGPTQPSGGNAVFTIGNAILGGAQGALNFSYRNQDGSLSFY